MSDTEKVIAPRWFSDRSLGTKFALLVTTILIVTLSVVTAYSIQTQQKLFTDNLRNKGEVLGNFISLISPQAILAYDFEVMTDYVREIGRENDVVYAVLIAANGINLTNYIDESKPIVAEILRESGEDGQVLEVVERIDVREDVVSLRFPIAFDGEQIGTVAIGLTTERIEKYSVRTLVRSLATTAIIIVFLVIALYTGFRLIVLRRVHHLQHGLEDVAGGDLNASIPETSRDEIGELTISFNQMVSQLSRSNREKDEAVQQLAEKASQLRKASDEAVRANRHKSEFLANMSHELRTPLNAIIGFSEVLKERLFGELNEKQGEYVEDIHSSGRHLLSLINDILDLSKIEAGHMELNLSSFDIAAAIDNALVLVKERAARHAIRIESHIDKRLASFYADERKFKQIMLNLLSNSIKFTPDGGNVSVWARIESETLTVAVQDSGIGIAPEDQEMIFEEFHQVGKDADTSNEGTGLGLALTRTFVRMHGGEIRVESEPGQGSTFTFTLPVLAQ